MGWGPVDWVGKSLPRSKIRNQMDFVFFIFILFLFERPLLLKSESVTNLLTWVGARDTCIKTGPSKLLGGRGSEFQVFVVEKVQLWNKLTTTPITKHWLLVDYVEVILD